MTTAHRRLAVLFSLPVLALATACERDVAGLDVSQAPSNPVVFTDALDGDIYYQPFFETYYDAMTVDQTFARDGFFADGARSLKFTVPPVGSALGPYTGGVLTSSGSRDLTDFNALTFWARADVPISLNEIGFGNDNTGTSRFTAGRANVALTTEWTYHVVPIPEPSRLIAERGLFTISEGSEQPGGYGIYFDDIQFAVVDDFEVFRPTLPAANRGYFVGSTVLIEGTNTIFLRDGAFVIVNHSPNYFDYASSDQTVMTVAEDGSVQVVGTGSAQVTATLDGIAAFGAVTVTAYDPPATGATAPTLPASDVISMFSDAYANVPVDTWRTSWSRAQFEDSQVGGNNVKLYSALQFVGIEFVNSPVDASEMEFLHLDVFAPAGSEFGIEIVSFPGVDGVISPKLTLDADSVPAFVPGEWSSLDIPLEDFAVSEDFDWSRIGQFVLSGNAQLVLVDNVYWHK